MQTRSPQTQPSEPLVDCLGQTIRQGEAYEAHLKEKFQHGIQTLKNIIPDNDFRLIKVHPSPKVLAYRCSAKFAVRAHEDSNLGYHMGLFKPGTHEVVHTTRCPTQVEALNRLFKDLYPLIAGFEIQPYNEQTHTGNLRYIVARASHKTNELMLTLVMQKPDMPVARALVQKLRSLNHSIKTAHINVNTEHGNAILSDQFIKISGNDYLRESINEMLFEMSPNAFFQVNPWQAANLYRRIEDLVGKGQGQHAWDLYSGVGQISMFLCRQGYQVLSLEEIPAALENSKRNARLNGFSDNHSGICGRVEDLKLQLATAPRPAIVTVNPSRRGLAPEVTSMLRDMFQSKNKTKLIYISCEMDTLARDTEALLQSSLKLRQIEGFDMFPHTEKMEWISVFTC